MKKIIYYANDNTKTKYYNKNNEEINKYYVQGGITKQSLKGDSSVLVRMGLFMEKYFQKNSSQIELINCGREFKEEGFRPLTEVEETLLWLGMNVTLKDENVKTPLKSKRNNSQQ